MRHFLILFVLIIITSYSGVTFADTVIKPKLNVVSEDYYPFSYFDNGVVTGSLVDLIEATSYTAGMPVSRKDIRIIPWSQAYITAQQIPDTLLLGVYRTPDRENLFKWIGPADLDPSVFFVRPGSQVTINTIQDVKKLKVGVVAGDAHYEMLRLYGIPQAQIFTTTSEEDLIRMVLNGDIDTFYYGERAGKALAKKVTGSPDALKTGLKFGISEIWFAMSLTSADSTVALLQNALQKNLNGDVVSGH